MKKAQVVTTTQVAEEDVDDVVELALQMMDADEGQLSMQELREIGEDLDIPAEYIERAQVELERTRAEARADERAATQRRAATIRYVLLGTGFVAFIVVAWSYSAVSSLSSLHASVQAQRAQVGNVIERKEAVHKTFEGKPDSADKTAELVGAENRIRVEQKRYFELTAKYNAAAKRFPASMFRGLAGLPAAAPEAP